MISFDRCRKMNSEQRVKDAFFRLSTTNTAAGAVGIDLSWSNLADCSAFYRLCSALETNARLLDLNLSNNKLGDLAGLAISKALKRNGTLITIDLQDNHLANQGLASLSEMLVVNTSLQALNITNNRYGHDGTLALAGAVADQRCCLFTLRMGGNSHGASSVAGHLALFKSLAANRTIRVIDFAHSRVGGDGAEIKSLIKMIHKNATLTSIELPHNRIGNAGAEALGRVIGELGKRTKKKKNSAATAGSKWGTLRGFSMSSSMMSRAVAAATAATRLTEVNSSRAPPPPPPVLLHANLRFSLFSSSSI